MINYEDEAGNVMSGVNLAERLNKFYISATSDLLPLDRNNELPDIRSSVVCKKLSEMNPFKSVGPDGILNRIWKSFAPELSLPITEIFFAYTFPTIWKDSFISPIPKVTTVTADGDLRPISLTLCIAKIQEDFALKWLTEDVQHKIDPQQFGPLKASSTTFCLLNMFENWLSSLDQPDHYLRICYLDFSKAFDNTDHNVLVKKFIDLGVRRSLIAWLCSFYSDRRQAVKFNSLISDWELCRDGIPQGTKLGPILFAIMIDDLAVKSPPTAYHWKFVDDVVLSEVVKTDSTSILYRLI